MLDVTIGRETERLERRLLFLATVGSSAPFVGLFGTVWGIMTSFQAIAASKNTALAVVAPGIAEALLATALGLLAAIPAVIAYNKLSNDAARSASGWRASPTSSPPSCRARSTRGAEPWPGSIGSAEVSARAAGASAARPMSEINVTPFVDVMLVLLIVFMVTAPLLSAGVPVDLPEAQRQAAGGREGADHGHDRHRRARSSSRTPRCRSTNSCRSSAAAVGGNLDERIYVRGDRAVSYGAIMRVMGDINGAGFRHIGLVSLQGTEQLSLSCATGWQSRSSATRR